MRVLVFGGGASVGQFCWQQTGIKRITKGAAAPAGATDPSLNVDPTRDGIEPARARLTAALYLADVATRYLVDRQAAAGAPLGAPGTWLIPALVGEMARFRAQQNGKH